VGKKELEPERYTMRKTLAISGFEDEREAKE
jgi:hypothetical protein